MFLPESLIVESKKMKEKRDGSAPPRRQAAKFQRRRTTGRVRERFIGFLVTLVALGWVGHLTAAGGDRGDLWGVGGW